MRHRNKGKRLGRESSHRNAMMTNLLISLVKHERLTTTLVRAKELSILADKIITLAKKNTQASIVELTKYIKSEREIVIPKLVNELAPRFSARAGGYTRVVKLGYRRGDAAPTAVIEYLDSKIADPKEVAIVVPETSTENI